MYNFYLFKEYSSATLILQMYAVFTRSEAVYYEGTGFPSNRE